VSPSFVSLRTIDFCVSQVLNLPLGTPIHTRPFALTLIYLSASLAPPGSQSSLFGLFTFPVIYLPYVSLAIDCLEGGPPAVATGVSGLVIGHVWWWGVWGGVTGSMRANGALAAYGVAPRWMRRRFGDDPETGAPVVESGVDGVYVTPPRNPGAATSGHNWGRGQRLGGS
jgi:Derlin-2/3